MHFVIRARWMLNNGRSPQILNSVERRGPQIRAACTLITLGCAASECHGRDFGLSLDHPLLLKARGAFILAPTLLLGSDKHKMERVYLSAARCYVLSFVMILN